MAADFILLIMFILSRTTVRYCTRLLLKFIPFPDADLLQTIPCHVSHDYQSGSTDTE